MKPENKVKEILGYYNLDMSISDIKEDKDFQIDVLMIALESANSLVRTQNRFINRHINNKVCVNPVNGSVNRIDK